MSLVGPRPHPLELNDLFMSRIPKYMLRHKVKPGVTGWAQVNGRNLLTWDKRLEMDVEYVESMSLRLDIKILFRTINDVLRQNDVLEVSSETVPDFDHYRKQHQSQADEN